MPKKKDIVFKALMVRDNTHFRVVVKAKKQGVTVDQFINNLLKIK